MPDYALEATNLKKSYGALVAVDDVSVELQAGECVGMLGPNGAGKSTTMRMCLGLNPADAGSIHMLGRPIPAQLLEARFEVGVVPQDDSLDPDFTVHENLMIYASYYRLDKAAVARRIPELLAIAELSERGASSIRELSGGLRRRLSLARALINDPKLVFLDEPTTGLDPQSRHLYWDRLRKLKNQGRALFLTTHYMEEAERLCDRLYIVDQGRIIASGRPRELIAQNVEREVVEIVGDGALAWANRHAAGLRVVELGESVYCYGDDVTALARESLEIHDLTFVRRSTNLEDVYLRVTGHALRD